MALRQTVGSDIAKDKFDVHISILTESFEKQCLGRKTFKNTSEGFDQFVAWVEKHKDRSIEETYTMEFTGVYYEMLAHYLRVSGKTVYVVIPSKAKKYAESLSYASKTDKLDAQSLAWMGLERNLKKWEPVSDVFMDMRSLTREREELVKEQTMVGNKLHALKNKSMQNFSSYRRYDERLTLIKKQISEIEDEINQLIKSDPQLLSKVRLVETAPGIGRITAATVLAETNGFSAILNQKQLTSYSGMDAKLVESGKHKGKTKISKQGNAHIRRVLYFPALSAMVHNPDLKDFHEKLSERKGNNMLSIIAVQRKLLCLMYSIWRSGKPYDKNYKINKEYEEDMKIRASQKGSPAQDINEIIESLVSEQK